MCGLSGVFDPGTAAAEQLRQTVAAMAARLVHRGPDAVGVWAEECIALGHRRLSVLDLSAAGHQPMHSVCGRFVIAYNGEIYNHLDLRRALEAAGAVTQWRGHSDTETLLAAIAHWGLDETLARAAGMFALALWDRRDRRLSLARDRIGEKPLYWGWAGTALVFGSELKALRVHPGFPREICREALALYLRFAYVPAPRSIHPGIYKLEPGTILEVIGEPPAHPPRALLRPGEQHGSLSIRRYWSLVEEIAKRHRETFDDERIAVEELEAALRGSVRRQLLADVPLGAFLSGGVDSSAVVALMQAESPRPARTFTVGFDAAGYDESGDAVAVARHLGTEHQTIRVTDADARAVIPRLPQMYDEPFADSSQIPTHLVCAAARREVAVALSGDGGDELFGGYNRYTWGPRLWKALGAVPMPLRGAVGTFLNALPPAVWDLLGGHFAGRRRGASGIAGLGDKAHKLGERIRGARSVDDLYRNLVATWLCPENLVGSAKPEPKSLLDDPFPEVPMSAAERMMFQDLRTYLPDDILCKVDRAAMAVSLETRVPMLDPEVIRVACRLPLHMKIRHGQGKWALRQVLYRHVPRELIERPKAGFAIPVGRWLRGPLRDWAEAMLAESALSVDGLLDPKPVRAAWAEHLSGRRNHTERLWAVLMLQAWRNEMAA